MIKKINPMEDSLSEGALPPFHCLCLSVTYTYIVPLVFLDSVTFIDLEYGGPNFRGFDLGDFFCGFAGSLCKYKV